MKFIKRERKVIVSLSGVYAVYCVHQLHHVNFPKVMFGLLKVEILSKKSWSNYYLPAPLKLEVRKNQYVGKMQS